MSDSVYEAMIPIEPRTKKNHQQIFKRKGGGHFVAPSPQYRQYEQDAMWYLRPTGINFPVNVKCLFYMGTRRKVDLTNLLEAIDDIMVKRTTLVDDNSSIIVAHDGSRVLYDKEHPRTEIYITRMQDDG